MFLGRCTSHDAVMTQFGLYVRLDLTPGAVLRELGYYNRLRCVLCPGNVFSLGNYVLFSHTAQVIIGVSDLVLTVLLCNLYKKHKIGLQVAITVWWITFIMFYLRAVWNHFSSLQSCLFWQIIFKLWKLTSLHFACPLYSPITSLPLRYGTYI